MLLEGKFVFRYNYNPTLKLYDRTPLPTAYTTNFSFDHIEQNASWISQIVEKAKFEATHENRSIFYRKNKTSSEVRFAKKPPFYISYRTPKMVCLTRQSRDGLDLIRARDILYLGDSILDGSTVVEIFIHYPGQLMRNLDNPSFATFLTDIRSETNSLDIKLFQSTILRKRPTKSKPCLKHIDDYDLYLQETVISKLGCIPPFWMYSFKDKYLNVPFSVQKSQLEECTSLAKLQEINKYIMDILKNRLGDIQSPCLDMFNSIGWNWIKTCAPEECGCIEISYLEKYYEEITQTEEFGFEQFISNLGGFIGIFLGYSMMQFPELLSKSFTSKLNLCLT